jgi:hypothetical protein
MMFTTTGRVILAVWLTIIVGLAIGSVVTLTMCAHHAPLHHMYACGFAKDYRHELHLPPGPCHVPSEHVSGTAG